MGKNQQKNKTRTIEWGKGTTAVFLYLKGTTSNSSVYFSDFIRQEWKVEKCVETLQWVFEVF